jgi:Arc/MetJ family transcription regulator
LTDLHQNDTIVHMRTTLNIDDRLLTEAQRLSGLKAKTAVLHAGLEALIARESAKRLATLGGHERRLKPIPRRRPGRRG